MITAHIDSFSYHEQPILKDLHLEFPEGHTYGIVGLNGAGKTTFFNLLAGVIRAEEAVFLREGQPLFRKDLAFIDTELFFYPKLTALEFLSVFPQQSSTYREDALAALFRLPLDGFIEDFSTGMKKKLLIQSQIKQDKAVYILDEPFNGLDLETNKTLEVIIAILNERGKTVFISSHILDPLLAVCHRIHYLKEQRVFKSYEREEFHRVGEDLFGQYTREIRQDLLKMI